MTDIKKAIKFPFQETEWTQKLIVGGILNIIPIISFFSIGYAYQVFYNALKEEPHMPQWNNWKNLFMNGLIIGMIGIAYFFIPFFINILGIYLITKGWLSSFLGGILLIIGFGGTLTAGFFFPMAITNYIAGGEQIGDAFKFSFILDEIRDVQDDYLASYLIGLGMLILFGLFLFVPVVSYFIFSIGIFYVYLSFSILFGETCKSITSITEEKIGDNL
ncbi:MAG: DUF4013 domain-containing protein [Thermodesulfobacteriota bacterium]|nr:DUF4013 domain-containing protein [Thermodesulfobacteriota bacterium]